MSEKNLVCKDIIAARFTSQPYCKLVGKTKTTDQFTAVTINTAAEI